ncbi:hypothetical protein R9C00_26465 [Flammeovirgaceae bacterium SG7u.111]|nr:hypothetical protein [Flammeovirgaceae bacterium SG7u.132]WPO35244.1 hypothetical protein R9C00_26465 [Flammeovirgaceae bacterium SG7u.111]
MKPLFIAIFAFFISFQVFAQEEKSYTVAFIGWEEYQAQVFEEYQARFADCFEEEYVGAIGDEDVFQVEKKHYEKVEWVLSKVVDKDFFEQVYWEGSASGEDVITMKISSGFYEKYEGSQKCGIIYQIEYWLDGEKLGHADFLYANLKKGYDSGIYLYDFKKHTKSILESLPK